MRGHLRGPAEYTVTFGRAMCQCAVFQRLTILDCKLDEYAKADLSSSV